MRTFVFIVLVCSTSFSSSALADPYDRQSDTRTETTEEIASGRKKWGFDFESGLSLRRGNMDISSGNLRLASFTRIGRLNSYVSGNYNYFLINQFRGVNLGNLAIRFDLHGYKVWRIFAFSTHGYNEFLTLDYRTANGLGFWADYLQPHLRIAPSIAISYEFEQFKSFGVERAARLPIRVIFEAEITDTAKLGFDFSYAPSLKELNDFRTYFEPYLETQIWKDVLGLKYRMTFERDNRPKPGVEKNDISTGVSFTLHFGE